MPHRPASTQAGAACGGTHSSYPTFPDRPREERTRGEHCLACWLVDCCVRGGNDNSMSKRAWRHVREFRNLGDEARARCCWTTLHHGQDDSIGNWGDCLANGAVSFISVLLFCGRHGIASSSLLRRVGAFCAKWNRLKAGSSLFCYILKMCISEKRFDCSGSLPEWQRSCGCVSSLLVTMRDTRKVS